LQQTPRFVSITCARQPDVSVASLAPGLGGSPDEAFPRVVLCLAHFALGPRIEQAGSGVEHHETLDPVRSGGSCQAGRHAALGDPYDGRAAETRGVHHAHELVDALLDWWRHIDGVRRTGARLVIHRDSPERRQLREKLARLRVLPEEVDVGDPAGHEQNLGWAVTEDLPRDLHAVALDVSGSWCLHDGVLTETATSARSSDVLGTLNIVRIGR
jgi:hypothetical protein